MTMRMCSVNAYSELGCVACYRPPVFKPIEIAPFNNEVVDVHNIREGHMVH